MGDDNRQERPKISEEMLWLHRNRPRLEQEIPGKWVAIKGSEIVAIGDGADEVADQAESKGIKRPLLAAIRSKEYQGVMMFPSWRSI
jgi:hypothetical protein